MVEVLGRCGRSYANLAGALLKEAKRAAWLRGFLIHGGFGEEGLGGKRIENALDR